MNVLSEPLWGKPSVDLHAPEHLYYAAHLILLCPEFLSFRALKIILHFLCALMLLLISLMFIWFFFFLFGSFQNLLLCSTFFFLISIYLAAPCLNCGRRDLLVEACGIQFPHQRLNPGHLHWERGVLATGPPVKSLISAFLTVIILWLDVDFYVFSLVLYKPFSSEVFNLFLILRNYILHILLFLFYLFPLLLSCS